MRSSRLARLVGTGFPLLFLQCALALEGPEATAKEPKASHETGERTLDQARHGHEAALAAVERARIQLERSAKVAAEAAADHETARASGLEGPAIEQHEIEAMRRELSRAQDELRRASREVVRAHRQLAHEGKGAPHAPLPHRRARRAIIGVILGDSTERGVEVLGISPDGPAERAGVKQGDLIVAVDGTPLASRGERPASHALLETMEKVKPGDELAITVERDGEDRDITVTAQAREPVGWTSLIRLPSAPPAPGAPKAPGSGDERIELPHIDEEALARKMSEVNEILSRHRIVVDGEGGQPHSLAPHAWEFEFENLSELGENMVHGAGVWFAMPLTRELKLAEVNEQLGEYFETDYGVLVLSAKEDNQLKLRPGDVMLAVGGQRVERPADVIRELRGLEPGATLQIEVMRKSKTRALDVVIPEQEVGFAPKTEYEYRLQVEHSSD